MAVRDARAVWQGTVKAGRGTITLASGQLEAPYSFGSRFAEEKAGTNPEELIAGAHAGCFSMALAAKLTEKEHEPARIETTAKVHLVKTDGGFAIPRVELETEAEVPGIDDAAFQELANDAKENCPVSKVLAAAEITLVARLLSGQNT